MDNTRLDSAFQRAVTRRGDAYLDARNDILEMGDTAIAFLDAKAHDADWRITLTAEIMRGWLGHRSLFEQCTENVQAKWVETSLQKPISGQASALTRARRIAGQGNGVVPRLLEMLTKTDEYATPIELDAILYALSSLADQRATMPLLELAEKSENESLRLKSVNILGSLKDQRAVEPLLRFLDDPIHSNQFRGTVAASLGAIGRLDAIEPLHTILSDEHNDIRLRERVAYGLGLLGNRSSVGTLTHALENTTDQELILAIVGAFGKIGDPATLPTLQRVEEQYPSGVVPRAVAKARQAIGRTAP